MTKKAIFAEAFWKAVPKAPKRALDALVQGQRSQAARDLEDFAALDLISIPDSPDRFSLGSLIRQLRPHQWAKNGLLFLPLLASHEMDPSKWLWTLIAFVTFSLLASSVYISNDLVDLEADRAHPTKSNRPIAKGDLSIKTAVRALGGLILFSIIGAIWIGLDFALVALIYFTLTTAYSFGLKSVFCLDIVFLAALFSIRVVAGAEAADVTASYWFLAFVAPIFLSLATVKRLTEVTKLDVAGRVPGRAYAKSDRSWLLGLAILSGFVAVGIFLAYSFSPSAQQLYEDLWIFRLIALPLGIWITRMIVTSWRGAQEYDPMSYAFKDPIGLSLVGLCAVMAVIAI